MPSRLALGLAILLIAIAALHLGWVFGLRWPAPRGGSVDAYVAGATKNGHHGPWPTIAVAAAILTGAAVILAYGAALAGPWRRLVALTYTGLTAVFVLRGLAGYVPAIWRYAEGTPFHRLNQLYYSPLCLLIGAGLVFNAIMIASAPVRAS